MDFSLNGESEIHPVIRRGALSDDRANSRGIHAFSRKYIFCKAERAGVEPAIPCGIHAFQACALGHYAISPP